MLTSQSRSCPLRRTLLGLLLVAILLDPGLVIRAGDVFEISADERMASAFSFERTAKYLDAAAIAWQKQHKCATCHTNFAHVMFRSALASVVPEPTSVRAFVEGIVETRWKTHGPRWDAEVIVAATTLGWNDRARRSHHSGDKRLSRPARTAFERMAQLQRPDGGWDWLKCGWPPMESDDHYGVTFAALGIGATPKSFRDTPTAQKMLTGIRKYLKANPGPSLHHRSMVLWSSTFVDGLLEGSARATILKELLSQQRDDGGWAVATMFKGWNGHRRKDDVAPSTTSDGYGTGFALIVARAAGLSRDDPRIRAGVKWLRSHQRASGRWYTPSPTKDSKHYLSNAGTAYAAYALAVCGEVAARKTSTKSPPAPTRRL